MPEKTSEYSQPSPRDLQPGGKSAVGFLEIGQTLEQVLNRDQQALRLLNYTQQEVADLLGPITERAANGNNFEFTARNGKRYGVEAQVYRGSQECPWGDPSDYRRSSGGLDMQITDLNTPGIKVRIAGLMRHLIENHGFFEGGAYRVAPEKIVEMFGTERVPGSIEKAKTIKF